MYKGLSIINRGVVYQRGGIFGTSDMGDMGVG